MVSFYKKIFPPFFWVFLAETNKPFQVGKNRTYVEEKEYFKKTYFIFYKGFLTKMGERKIFRWQRAVLLRFFPGCLSTLLGCGISVPSLCSRVEEDSFGKFSCKVYGSLSNLQPRVSLQCSTLWKRCGDLARAPISYGKKLLRYILAHSPRFLVDVVQMFLEFPPLFPLVQCYAWRTYKTDLILLQKVI